jgi:putative MATE family efflux protein
MYTLVDTYFLGKLGKEAISAPSITMNVSNFIIVFGTAFSIAGTTMISQALGADNHNRERIDFLASQVFLVNTVMSIMVMILGILLARPLMTLMQVPSGLTTQYTLTYMTITFLTMPLLFGDFVLRTTLQGTGDSLTPLYVQIIAVVLNIILDPLFIFGWGPINAMGVAGAAWATFIARSVSCSVSLYLLFVGYRRIRVRFSLMRPHRQTLTLLVRIGLPSSIGQSISSLGFAVVQGVVNSFGPAVIAAFGIGNRIQSIFHMPAYGLSQGTAVLVGKKLGEKDPESAAAIAKRSMIISGVFISIGMTLVLIFGRYVIRFFVDDPQVVHYGVQMFWYTAPSVVCFALYTVVLGAFQGGGETRPVMTMNLVRLWGLRVPLCYLLPIFFGTHGMWLAMLLSNAIVAAWALILYRRGSWKVSLYA